MPRAVIVYWYGEADLRPDGGGLRVRAWLSALRTLGYSVSVAPLWTFGPESNSAKHLSSLKRAVLPMPVLRRVPHDALNADLVVVTVPSVMPDALSRLQRQRVVLDWADMWSVNARTVGDARWSSWLGGRAQSWRWARRERRLLEAGVASTFAGYDDFARSATLDPTHCDWAPTPIGWQGADSQRRSDCGVTRNSRLGFIGNLDYPPNELSLRRFCDQYSGRLKAAGFELVVAGFGTGRVANWGYDVRVIGPVEDVATFYDQIDAVVVPIEHGGGIKVKAIEAFATRSLSSAPNMCAPGCLLIFVPLCARSKSFRMQGVSPSLPRSNGWHLRKCSHRRRSTVQSDPRSPVVETR